MEIEMGHKFKKLLECKPGELVRINLGDRTEWAIVAKRVPTITPVVVLSGEGAPYTINAEDDAGLKDEFADRAVLSWGSEYSLGIGDVHFSHCDVHDGILFGRNGSLILTDGEKYLRCYDHRRQPRFLCIGTGELRSEIGTKNRAAFGEWHLWLNKDGEPPTAFTFSE
jgi:hypothetical protein